MVKEKLKSQEPLVYACLLNDLKDRRLAHSYLLCGDPSPLKKDTAYLIAQSIIEDNAGFACEVCDTCIRVRNNSHLDVLFIDGEKETIKKEEVEEMLDEFYKTAAEASGKKVYIVSNINNATTKVLNMILKFMEEPSNGNTFGIFISDDANNLLPTVVSRCEKLEFKCRDYSQIKNDYLNNGYDLIDAYLLSETFFKYDESYKDTYLISKDYLFKLVENLSNPEYIPVIFFSEVYPFKDFKSVLDVFLKLIVKVLDDSISSHYIGEREYDTLLDDVRPHALGLLEIFMEASGILDRNNSIDRKLLFDQISYKILSYMGQVKR